MLEFPYVVVCHIRGRQPRLEELCQSLFLRFVRTGAPCRRGQLPESIEQTRHTVWPELECFYIGALWKSRRERR